MSDHTEQETQPAGRTLLVSAYGDSQNALELAALDEARQFFGAEVQLEVVRDYRANALGNRAEGQRYWAQITVREVLAS